MPHELESALRGRVLEPGSDGYDAARSMWNARFDRRPDVVACCADVEDVSATLRWARRAGAPVSVKGAGHSYSGNTVADGGVLIDLSAMDGVEVDAVDRIAHVQGGATWAQVDAETQRHGLATPGVTVSSVGVAGSTLGAGTGWLSRCLGNAADNLLAVELVTADGEILRSSADENPELFWGVRGAGANLGVVTSLDFELHDVGPEVLAGQIIYRFDEAEKMLRAFGSFIAEAADELQCLPFTFRAPPVDPFPESVHGEPVLDFVVFHRDPGAIDAIAPLRDLGDPVVDAVGPMPYTLAQQAFDVNMPSGQRYYSRAHDLAELTEAAIDDFAAHVRQMRGPLTASYLEPRGGAVAREASDATAAGGRQAPYSFHIIAGWTDPAEDTPVMDWARAFAGAMERHATGGVYVNLLAEDEAHRVPSVFSDYVRVQDLKRRWDPDNVFAGNHNVSPS
ncbi:MAG: FAD-binding oxidoreductase [Acidimicrobiia bacterium]